MKKLIAYIMIALVVIGAGCMGPISESITPVTIDHEAVETVEAAGTGHASDYKGILFPSLASARKLKIDLTEAIALSNQELRHLAEAKQLKDTILTGSVLNSIQIGETCRSYPIKR